MIRGNYSLAKEVRKNELKQRQKIQQRQKHQHTLQKLQQVDPIRLYFHIQKLEASQAHDDQSRLKQLKDDWKFIEKHKLHQEKLQPFLEEQRRKQEQKRKADAKLWGKKSVFFNPELNPLGKVPDALKLGENIEGRLPNATVPLKSTTKYPVDPLILTLNVVLPEGPRPQFYKSAYNTAVEKKEKSERDKSDDVKSGQIEKAKPPPKRSNLDSDSDAEIQSDEEYYESKRSKLT